MLPIGSTAAFSLLSLLPPRTGVSETLSSVSSFGLLFGDRGDLEGEPAFTEGLAGISLIGDNGMEGFKIDLGWNELTDFLRFPEPSLRASRPPGPKLLLRDFFVRELGRFVPPIV